jgi:hypothetical protein
MFFSIEFNRSWKTINYRFENNNKSIYLDQSERRPFGKSLRKVKQKEQLLVLFKIKTVALTFSKCIEC